MSGSEPLKNPVVSVIAREKAGKSSLATTLFDWPYPGARPLVLAFDETGPDACARIGRPVHTLKPKQEQGATMMEKVHNLTLKLHTYLQPGSEGRKLFNCVVVDCLSTFCEDTLEEIARITKNPDPRSHYAHMGKVGRMLFYRLIELRMPIIIISWLREAETTTDKGVTRLIPGGMLIPGKQFAGTIAGRAHAIVMLEKRSPMPGDPPEAICADGAARIFHTKDHAGVRCESRFALPPIMPANLAWLMHYLMNGYQPPQQVAQGQVVQNGQLVRTA